MKASTRFVLGLVGIVLSLFLVPGVSRGKQTVAPGWDLFSTPAGNATFGGQSFEGVPIDTFDFGGNIGIRRVGNTDTIVQRLSAATAPTSTIPDKLAALQLESVNAVNFGLGTGHYFITLQSTRGGPASTGDLTIAFGTPPGTGTLDSSLNVDFDIRKDSLTGPIAMSSSLALTGTAPWSHNSPAGALLIDGVNHLLNGTDTREDFWPTNLMLKSHLSEAVLNPVTAVPETKPTPPVTFTSNPSPVVEGDTGSFRFTFHNNTKGDIDLVFDNAITPTVIAGDPSDSLKITSDVLPSQIHLTPDGTPGDNGFLDVAFNTPALGPDEDKDTGLNQIKGTFLPEGTTFGDISFFANVLVMDPGAPPVVPESSNLVLIGGALSACGLGWLRRRRILFKA